MNDSAAASGDSQALDATYETLGMRVRARRKELDLTVEQVAVMAGVAYRTVSAIEADERRKPECLIQLARALRVSVTWLSTGQGEKLLPESTVITLPLGEPAQPTAAAQALDRLWNNEMLAAGYGGGLAESETHLIPRKVHSERLWFVGVIAVGIGVMIGAFLSAALR